MITMDGVAISPRDIGPNKGGLTAADHLRVAFMTIAAYEYVVRKVLMTLIVTYRGQLSPHYPLRISVIQDYKST